MPPDNAPNFRFAFLKVFVGIPAVTFGFLTGIPIYLEFKESASLRKALSDAISAGTVPAILGWWVAGSLFILLLRTERWGLNRNQLRLTWFGASLLGLLGGPLAFWWIQR